ncbi:MAG: RS21-C6 protein, partial [Phototrophicales bacterium]
VEHEGIENASTVELRDEFADVLAFLLKLANYVGIDLETAYIEKMKLNQKRSW